MKENQIERAAIVIHPAKEISRQLRFLQIRKLSAARSHGAAGAGAAATRSGKGGKCGGGMGGMRAGGVKGGAKRKTHVGGK